MAKTNKDVLKTVNKSLQIVGDIKEGKVFNPEEKRAILDNFTSLDEGNNGYYTPVEITKFMISLLDIKKGSKIADLSSGIGNFVIPLMDKEYGKLKDDITFDLFELEEAASLALNVAWSDYPQVTVNHNSNVGFNTILREQEILDNSYDVIVGNPPFSSSLEYFCEWNNDKGKIKKNKIVDAFVDMAIRKCKVGGLIALVLPGGSLYNSNATAKLREWMRTQGSLLAVFPLDGDVFSAAGVCGTGVGTNIIVFQRGVTQGKIFIGDLIDKKDIVTELNSMALQFQLFLSRDYHLEQSYDYAKLIKGKGFDWESDEEEEEISEGIECNCCTKKFPEYQISEYELKDGSKKINVCIECENSQEVYLDKIKRNCLIDGQVYSVSRAEEKIILSERDRRLKEEDINRLRSCKKHIYYFSNAEKFELNHQAIRYCNGFLGVTEDSDSIIQRMKFNYVVNKHWIIDESWDKSLGKIDIYLDSFKREIQKVKKPEETEWRERTRTWWSGRIICEEDFYNATFGFSTYSDDGEMVNDVYVNYQFLCSKSYKLSKKIMQLLKDDGFNVDL